MNEDQANALKKIYDAKTYETKKNKHDKAQERKLFRQQAFAQCNFLKGYREQMQEAEQAYNTESRPTNYTTQKNTSVNISRTHSSCTIGEEESSPEQFKSSYRLQLSDFKPPQGPKFESARHINIDERRDSNFANCGDHSLQNRSGSQMILLPSTQQPKKLAPITNPITKKDANQAMAMRLVGTNLSPDNVHKKIVLSNISRLPTKKLS